MEITQEFYRKASHVGCQFQSDPRAFNGEFRGMAYPLERLDIKKAPDLLRVQSLFIFLCLVEIDMRSAVR